MSRITILSVLIPIFICGSAFSQTYANDSLRVASEKHIAEKNIKLNITPVEEKDEKEPDFDLFDESVLSANIYSISQLSWKSSSLLDEKEKATLDAEVEEEFAANNFILDFDNKTIYMISRHSLLFRKLNFKIVDGFVTISSCKECQDSKYRIISKSQSGMMLSIPSQDNGGKVEYVLTLRK